MYTVISDFRFGLDARRSELVSRSGLLKDLINAHVNQGGEIEKRKAFTKIDLTNGNVTTYGIEAGSDGIYVFGDLADPGGWPTNVKYQRLVIPPVHGTDTAYLVP